ncbi:MAG: hypothetical protein KDA16_12150 [Phycisphaerales bacterium]|nr:hypothetical protein [Phycisphaerales bacterium]
MKTKSYRRGLVATMALACPGLVPIGMDAAGTTSDPGSRPEIASTEKDASGRWYVLETKGDVPAPDRELLDRALRTGAESLEVYFDDEGLNTILRSLSIRVVIHAEPDELANEYTATTRSGFADDSPASYHAEIHMLAPSAHPQGLTTSIGEPKDRAYYERLAVHELSTVPLELATRIKGDGWRLRSAPAWFVQGYEEYLGMTCAPGDAGAAALDRRTAMVVADPHQVDDSFGLDVRDPYATGVVVLRFMHERYGADRVRSILLSREPTFGRAVRASLGVDLDGFMRDWRAWLERQSAPD